MIDFVKVKIISCSGNEKYHELVGQVCMARTVPENKYYRTRHEKYPYILKKDCEPSNELGRNF